MHQGRPKREIFVGQVNALGDYHNTYVNCPEERVPVHFMESTVVNVAGVGIPVVLLNQV